MPSARLRALRLRLLSQLDQKYGREKAVLRKAIKSLEARLRKDRLRDDDLPKDSRRREL
jgi:hypothetical protein